MELQNYQGTIIPRGFPLPPSDWVYESVRIPGSDGNGHLYGYACSRAATFGERGAPGAHRALLVIHGMGEHGGRYLPFASHLSGTVDTVFAYDHRGHGRSEGMRGHIDRFDLLVEDAASVVRWLHEKLVARHGKSEIHLFAHSLGGHIGLRMLLLNADLPIASASISAPFLGLPPGVAPVKKIAARILAGGGLGWLQLDTGLDASQISRDPAAVEAYQRDRLVHGKMTPRFFSEVTRAMADTLAREGTITPPIQMQIPLQDGLVDPEKALQFFRQLKSREKSLKTYPGYYHEAFNDIGRDQFIGDLDLWVRSHSVGRSSA